MPKMGLNAKLNCPLGSCDDHIFSLLCHNRILNLGCPRYDTLKERDDDSIGKISKKLRKSPR